MFRRVTFEEWQILITTGAFFLIFLVFVYFSYRAIRLARDEGERLASMPLSEDEQPQATNSRHEQPAEQPRA